MNLNALSNHFEFSKLAFQLGCRGRKKMGLLEIREYGIRHKQQMQHWLEKRFESEQD